MKPGPRISIRSQLDPIHNARGIVYVLAVAFVIFIVVGAIVMAVR